MYGTMLTLIPLWYVVPVSEANGTFALVRPAGVAGGAVGGTTVVPFASLTDTCIGTLVPGAIELASQT